MCFLFKLVVKRDCGDCLRGFRLAVFVIFMMGAGFGGSLSWAQEGQSVLGEAAFFSNLEDVPLMPGISELPEEGMVFDKPEGRIVEGVALMGGRAKQDVLTYYGGILPQLGWGRVKGDRFYREGEVLDIHFITSSRGNVVKITIRPIL